VRSRGLGVAVAVAELFELAQGVEQVLLVPD
jgi:hypothetical protein